MTRIQTFNVYLVERCAKGYKVKNTMSLTVNEMTEEEYHEWLTRVIPNDVIIMDDIGSKEI